MLKRLFSFALVLGFATTVLAVNSPSDSKPELVLQSGDASTEVLAYSGDGAVLATAGSLEHTIRAALKVSV